VGGPTRRRVLDLIGKATPGTFQPSLQIDGTGAKLLLIEALSGRWSYDTDRRERRTVWYRQPVLSPRLNDSSHAEQRTNQDHLELRQVTYGVASVL